MNHSAQNITLPLHVIEDVCQGIKVMSQILDVNKDYLSVTDATRARYAEKLFEEFNKKIKEGI